MVAAGTCAEYAPPALGPCDPDATPLAPSSPYARAKDSLRRILLNLSREYGFSLAWPRLFFLYGPFEHAERLVPSVTLSLLKGEEARSTHGRQVRDYMDVRDCGAALAATVLSATSGTLNICSGRPTPLLEILSALAQTTGRPDLLRIGARPAPDHEAPNLWGSAERLRTEVGFAPRYDLSAGLRDAVDYWRDVLRRGSTASRAVATQEGAP
jgi:nucleoside-diphosphate-sugar epimerase